MAQGGLTSLTCLVRSLCSRARPPASDCRGPAVMGHGALSTGREAGAGSRKPGTRERSERTGQVREDVLSLRHGVGLKAVGLLQRNTRAAGARFRAMLHLKATTMPTYEELVIPLRAPLPVARCPLPSRGARDLLPLGRSDTEL